MERITRLLREAREHYLRAFAKRLHSPAIMAGSNYSDTPVTYLFRNVEGTSIVLIRPDTTGQTILLEPRRDLYKYDGRFAWATETQVLSFSLCHCWLII